jgi:hypothetical protein
MGAIDSLIAKMSSMSSGGGGGGGGANPGTYPGGGVSSVSSAAAVAALTGGTPTYTDSYYREGARGYTKALGGTFASAAGQAAMGFQAMLPTAEEAISMNLIGNRNRFYTGGDKGTSLGQTYNQQQLLAHLGTSSGAFDAVSAMNAGAGMGLLPGLSNFKMAQGFQGVSGGAALASNLTPGLGLTGGMSAMAQINQASTVNKLRMIGVSVRNSQGEMRDLPDIIKQIYDLLERGAGKPPTAALIAVSAMSGNALDSLLTQFFGSDSEARQTVLAGLIQMANKNGVSLATSGTKSAMEDTGGTSGTINSLAERNRSELKMLQDWEFTTNQATRAVNDIGSGIFNYLGKNAQDGVMSSMFKTGQEALSGLTVFGGLRGGAGQMVTDSLLSGGLNIYSLLKANNKGEFDFTDMGKKMNLQVDQMQLAKTGAVGLGAAAVAQGLGQQINAPDYKWTDTPMAGKDVNPPVVTGSIIINVAAPSSEDPYTWAKVIGDSISSVKRS